MALCENDIFSSFVKVGFGYAATTRRFSASIGRENNFSSRVANVCRRLPDQANFEAAAHIIIGGQQLPSTISTFQASSRSAGARQWFLSASRSHRHHPRKILPKNGKNLFKVAQPFFKRACPWKHD
jgi:hypothetical protein